MNRVLNFSAIVVSSMVFLASGHITADVIYLTEGSTSGYTMTDGNTYVIQNSVSFSNSTAGGQLQIVGTNQIPRMGRSLECDLNMTIGVSSGVIKSCLKSFL